MHMCARISVHLHIYVLVNIKSSLWDLVLDENW